MLRNSEGRFENPLILEFQDIPVNQKSISEAKSVSPQARTGQLSAARPLTAFQAIAATISVLDEAQSEFWITEKWIRSMAQRCYSQQYEGQWATLQVLLQTSTNSQEFRENALEILGARTFFGNLVPFIARYSRTVRLRPEEVNRRARRRIRRRGYTDKGHRIEDHEHHGIQGRPDSGIPLLDYRHLILHPLLITDENKDKNPGCGSSPSRHVSEVLEDLLQKVSERKEAILNVNIQRTGSRGTEGNQSCREADTERTTSEQETETRSKETSSQESVRQESTDRERDTRDDEISQT